MKRILIVATLALMVSAAHAQDVKMRALPKVMQGQWCVDHNHGDGDLNLRRDCGDYDNIYNVTIDSKSFNIDAPCVVRLITKAPDNTYFITARCKMENGGLLSESSSVHLSDDVLHWHMDHELKGE
jgi:hypothetical protein